MNEIDAWLQQFFYLQKFYFFIKKKILTGFEENLTASLSGPFPLVSYAAVVTHVFWLR